MKKIILFILLLTFSQKIIYAFDLITVPKDISKLNILGITFDSKIADIKKLLSTGSNLTGRIIPMHFMSSHINRVSVSYYIEPKTDSEVLLGDYIIIDFFNDKITMILIGINYFLNGTHAKPLELLYKTSDPSIFDGLGDLLLQELSTAYGDYQIKETPIIGDSVDAQRAEWNKGKYIVNYLLGHQAILFTNNDIIEKARTKALKQSDLEDASTARVNANRVAFRDQAGTSSKVLTRLSKGELLTNLEKAYSFFEDGSVNTYPVAVGPWRALWYKVRRSNGQEGWVYGWFLDPAE